MTTGRLVLRCVLVLLLLAVCGLGAMLWWQRGPDYEWNQAQAAAEQENWEVARIHLLKLLAEDAEHAEGHRELARVYLAEAAAANGASNYASNPAALNHLAEAAKLKPEDLELQERLLAAYLQVGRYNEAALIGKRVLAGNPEHADALFACAWKAIDQKNYQESRQLLDKLAEQKTLRPFQTLSLLGSYHQNTNDSDKLQEVLQQSLETAQDTDPELLASLSANEHRVMFDLFRLAIVNAPTVEIAHERVGTMLEVFEEQSAQKNVDLSVVSLRLAELVHLVSVKFPLDPKSDVLRSRRDQLSQEGAEIWKKAIEAEGASPLVFYKAAEAAFSRGEIDQGLSWVESGLAAASGATDEEVRLGLNLHLLAARQLVLMRRFNEAENHVSALIAHEYSSGWGHLIAGSVASNRGELENALEHYLRAQKKLGNTLMVQMALAKVYIVLEQWDKAFPHLVQVRDSMNMLDPEQRAWVSQQIGNRDDLQFALFRTQVGLDQWNKAQESFAALVGTPLEADARLLATLHLAKKGGLKQADAFLAESRQKFPDDRRLALLQAKLLANNENPDAAHQALEDYASKHPGDFSIRVAMCNWFIVQKEFDLALELLDEFDQQQDLTEAQQLSLTGLRCKTYLAMGEPQRVIDLASSLQENGRSEHAVQVLTASAQLFNKDLDSASQTLDQIAAGGEAKPKLQLLRGAVAAARGEYTDSLEFSAEALEVTALRGQAESVILQVIEQLARQRSADEALAEVEKLLEKHPHAHLLEVARVKLLIHVGQVDKGMQQLDSMLAEDSENLSLLQLKTQALLHQGQLEPAWQVAQECVRLAPDKASLFAARVALLNRKPEAALTHSREALRLDSSLKQAYLIQAEAFMLSDKPTSAEEVVKKLVNDHEDWPDAHVALINLHLRENRLQDALQVARKAQTIFPDQVKFVTGEVDLLARLKRGDEADQVAQKQFANQADATFALSIAQAFNAQSMNEYAIKWSEQALDLGTDQVTAAAHLMLGNIYLKEFAGSQSPASLEHAREHFAAVLEEHPQHLIAGNNLAWILASELNQAEEAVQICERIRAGVPVENLPLAFADTMAMSYRKAKKLSLSESLAVSILNIHPHSATIHYQLGLTLIESGRKEEARQALEKSVELGLEEPKAAEARQFIASLKT